MATMHRRPAISVAHDRRAEGTRRKVRILLVEDDDDVRLLLTLALKQAGYQVTATANADLALQALRTGRHDLILTDYCLPRKDGLQFLAEASSAGVICGAPVIVCTAFPPTPASGMTVLEKPIDIDSLLQKIRAALKRSAET
jgi:DNA-binding response OmpR family regulator